MVDRAAVQQLAGPVAVSWQGGDMVGPHVQLTQRGAPALRAGVRGAIQVLLAPVPGEQLLVQDPEACPFLRAPSGCHREHKVVVRLAQAGSFCWCRRRKEELGTLP